ncbi:cysteine desulfurase [Gordonia sp. TBRC 11910]|uniref:Cysteine desulfurase n=1 Tax=Gordonia asplenii TaxID=2725283 RepID=A0A848L140_9ACTN|nr:cysteine desulfurase family protein [Gordonia asplenii]NMO01388.1 cysteine desulfurase [Gordonia asplenii]
MSSSPRATVYLDNAASQAMLPVALEAMIHALTLAGNASSLHGSGRRTRRLLEESRETIAAALGARPSEVLFTSGGTEADNLAVKGIFLARHRADPRRRRIVLSAVEHHAILDSAEWLAAAYDAELVILPVDAQGFVDPDDLRRDLAEHAEHTALVSVMWANNEVGTIEPIAELAAIGSEFGVPVHSDAVQAVGHVPVDFAASQLSAMSLAAHKFGGPQGIGVLLIGRDVECVPLAHGGGHERDLRSGTQNVAGAVAMAAALRYSVDHLTEAAASTSALADRLTDVLLAYPDTVRNGPADPALRLPGIVHVTFEHCEGDSLLMLLDAQGVECSTGSACTAGVAQASHVLLAMGLSMEAARGSLRFSLGPATSLDDIAVVADVFGPILDRARAAGLVGSGRLPIAVQEGSHA